MCNSNNRYTYNPELKKNPTKRQTGCSHRFLLLLTAVTIFRAFTHVMLERVQSARGR